MAGCAPSQPTPAPLTKLKVVTSNYLGSSLFYIAQQEGYFAEQGIEVELIPETPQQELLPLLIQGEVDAMNHAFNSGLLNAMAGDPDIRLVAAGVPWPEECVWGGLLARKELLESGALDDLSSASEYRFALRSHSFPAYMTERFLRSVNVKVEDLKTTTLASSIMGEALRTGSIDIVWVGEPWTTRILQEGYADVWAADHEIWPGYSTGGLVFGTKLFKENRELGQRFVIAYAKGFFQYLQGKTERNLELASEFTQLDRELLLDVCWPTSKWDGQPNLEGWLDYQEWAMEKGLLDKRLSVDEFWDGSFIEQATKVLGEAQ
jgi:NitT/TauT family transport system substrate-binding protein